MKAFVRRYSRILAETIWIFAGQGLSALATLVGLRLITEFVPPDVYGTVTLALGVVALAHGLAAGPLMQAVLRYYPDVAREGSEAVLRQASLRALRRPLGIAYVVLVAGAIGWAIVQPQQLGLAFATLTLILTEVARSVEITFLNAARRQREMALLMAGDAWLRPLAAVALVWFWGPHGTAVMTGYLIGSAAALATYWTLSRRWRGVLMPGDGSSLRDANDLPRRLRIYALPLTALPLIGWVSGQADRYLLGALAGVAEAGLYAALYGLASKPFLLFSASVELALRQPYYARVSAGDVRGASLSLCVWLGVVMTGALAMCWLFAAFHEEIAGVLLAEEYRAHSKLMGWIAAGYVLLAIAQVLERVCYANHDTRGVLGVQAFGALLSVVIAAPLIARYNLAGAAWATPIYFGAQLILTILRAARAWRLTPDTPTNLPAATRRSASA